MEGVGVERGGGEVDGQLVKETGDEEEEEERTENEMTEKR